jgi:hypothetical protein
MVKEDQRRYWAWTSEELEILGRSPNMHWFHELLTN